MREFILKIMVPPFYPALRMLAVLIVCVLGIGITAPALGKDRKKAVPEEVSGNYSALIPPAAVTKNGLFTVHQVGEKWYFEIPDSLLNRLLLSVTRFVSAPANPRFFGGEVANQQVVYWEKAGKKMLLRAYSIRSSADGKGEIRKAVAVNNACPIVACFPIEAERNSCSLIEITELVEKDIPAFSIRPALKSRCEISGYQQDKSFIKSIRTFPLNTEMKTVRTYLVRLDPSGEKDCVFPVAETTGLITAELNTSFILLPKEPMRRRLYDLRVGYFAHQYEFYGDTQQMTGNKKFICRWRLEPRPEDVEKMKRGELVEPRKPIVFYIDPATPRKWRKYMIKAVEDWQPAFEEAGFKNAIYAREWPEDDPEMDLEDIRYSIIHYIASPVANSNGHQISDPRSGEIIQARVGWHHNVMKLVHDWYMVQAGIQDPQGRKMYVDDELMGRLIEFICAHEVGHTLGLRHNLGASRQTPVEKLRDRKWLEENGHTVSIMDYARFNYVAQPEDSVSVNGLFPRIGIYDKWAIQWGYTPLWGTSDDEEDRLLLNEMIKKKQKENKRLWFGAEGYNRDPRCQREDLGDNPVMAAEYGIRNLKRVMKALPEWTYEKGDFNTHLLSMHKSVIDQYRRFLIHAAVHIGGIYRNFKVAEEEGIVYEPVERETQKQALQFLGDYLFTPPDWLFGEQYLYRIYESPQREMHKIIDDVLSPDAYPLLDPETFIGMKDYAADHEGCYTVEEYLSDLKHILFRELQTRQAIGNFRRHSQQVCVESMVSLLKDEKYKKTDVPVIARNFLTGLAQDIQKNERYFKDTVSREHLAYLYTKIQNQLK